MTYAVLYCRSAKGYKASVPDLPECVAEGESLEEAKRRIREVITGYLEGLQRSGQQVPLPTTQADLITVVVPGEDVPAES